MFRINTLCRFDVSAGRPVSSGKRIGNWNLISPANSKILPPSLPDKSAC